MFSTPQSKAFFSQQIVKGKLIAEQINLINAIHDKIWQSKTNIQDIIKILWMAEDRNELMKQKLGSVSQNFECALQILDDSNETFAFQVSLRNDIKHLEQLFFKKVMIAYQQKIKQLKHSLLSLEHQVQSLEQKGLLPYIENPVRNSILSFKYKNYYQYLAKIQVKQKLVDLLKKNNIKNVLVSIVDSILQKKANQKTNTTLQKKQSKKGQNITQKQKLDKSQQMHKPLENQQTTNCQFQAKDTLKQKQKGKQQKKLKQPYNYNSLNQMMQLLYNWLNIMNTRLSESSKGYKKRIQILSSSNKKLKEGIRNYKKIMHFEQNQAAVRYGRTQLSRQQAIDFLRDMNQDLQTRFSRRNVYMIVNTELDNKLAKSCISVFECEQTSSWEQNKYNVLRQVNPNLNNSFLDQCSYLISDRFQPGQEQNGEQIV